MQWLGAIGATFGLGFIYFVAAIPTGVALGLPLWLVALVTWLGYTCGGLIIVLVGEPLRDKLMRRFKVNLSPDNPSFIRRVWDRYGLWAMVLLAPVTIGPQVSALLGLALGEPKRRLTIAIAVGIIPWIILFTTLAALGVSILKE